jgi:hypothetical protein
MYLKTPGSKYRNLALIAAPPKVTKVEVATHHQFHVDGTSTWDWRPLSREGGGALWVGHLSPAESYLGELQSEGGEITSGFGNAPSPTPEKGAVEIAPAGSDLAAVRSAGIALRGLIPSLEEQPVLSASRRLTGTAQLAVAVLRSPEGAALVGFSEYDLKFKATSPERNQLAYAIAKQPLGDPDKFMIALSTRPDSSARYVVLTPVGATSARIGKVTVPVVNRLARFERSTASGQVTVEALNAQGQVIATVASGAGF